MPLTTVWHLPQMHKHVIFDNINQQISQWLFYYVYFCHLHPLRPPKWIPCYATAVASFVSTFTLDLCSWDYFPYSCYLTLNLFSTFFSSCFLYSFCSFSFFSIFLLFLILIHSFKWGWLTGNKHLIYNHRKVSEKASFVAWTFQVFSIWKCEKCLLLVCSNKRGLRPPETPADTSLSWEKVKSPREVWHEAKSTSPKQHDALS